MRTVAATIAGLGIVLGLVRAEGGRRQEPVHGLTHAPYLAGITRAASDAALAGEIPAEELTAVVRRVCGLCHNDQLKTGNLSLTSYDVAAAPTVVELVAEPSAGTLPRLVPHPAP